MISSSRLFRRFLHLTPVATPNPASVKILLHQQQTIVPFITQSLDVSSSTIHIVHHPILQQMCQSLLAKSSIVNLYLTPEFITVNVKDGQMWQTYYDEIVPIVKQYYYKNIMDCIFPSQADSPAEDTMFIPIVQKPLRIYTTEIEQQIEEIVERYILPSVLEDGGNIVLDRYEPQTKTAYIELQGACKSCHSSYITLKNNVENTLRHFVPEVELVEESK